MPQDHKVDWTANNDADTALRLKPRWGRMAWAD